MGHLKRICSSLDTLVSAERLLEAVGLDIDGAHQAQAAIPIVATSSSHYAATGAAGAPMHRISVVGVSLNDRGVLEAMGLSVRAAKAHARSWRFETARADSANSCQCPRHPRAARRPAYVLQGHMLEKSLPFITAAASAAAWSWWLIPAVRRRGAHAYETYDAEVYDINVERTHNFIATVSSRTNSIYRLARRARWRTCSNFAAIFPRPSLQAGAELSLHRTILKAGQRADLGTNGAGSARRYDQRRGRESASNSTRRSNERDEADFVVNRIREWVAHGARAARRPCCTARMPSREFLKKRSWNARSRIACMGACASSSAPNQGRAP